MFEEELYAVDLDGEIGYCSLMGRNGQHAALAVYVGEQGFSSLRYSQEIDPGNVADLLSQDCVQCSLEKREEFMPEELAAIQAYCKKAGLSFRAPFPQFSRYYPHCIPIPIPGKADWLHLRTALRVVNVLTELLQEHTKEELHLQPIVFNKGRQEEQEIAKDPGVNAAYVPNIKKLYETGGAAALAAWSADNPLQNA